mgnify:CR=1 FL=1
MKKFNIKEWQEKHLNERPISRSKVDYSTIDLKSNIDMKWTSTDDMEHDLRQWLEAVFSASGPQLMREVGLVLREIGTAAIKDGDVDGEVRPTGAASKFD